jgi:hypothetical protein
MVDLISRPRAPDSYEAAVRVCRDTNESCWMVDSSWQCECGSGACSCWWLFCHGLGVGLGVSRSEVRWMTVDGRGLMEVRLRWVYL